MIEKLTQQQQSSICGYLQLGADRATAVRMLGVSLAALQHAIVADEKFANEVDRAEGFCEFGHQHNIQKAGQDEKHWRASVWWLERRAADRYARSPAGAVTTADLQSFTSSLVAVLMDEFGDESALRRIRARMQALVSPLPTVSREDIDDE